MVYMPSTGNAKLFRSLKKIVDPDAQGFGDASKKACRGLFDSSDHIRNPHAIVASEATQIGL